MAYRRHKPQNPPRMIFARGIFVSKEIIEKNAKAIDTQYDLCYNNCAIASITVGEFS